MKKIFGSPSRLFVSLLLFVATLAMTQAPLAQEASAVGMEWIPGGPSSTRLVGVDSSNDGMIAYATENPTNASRKIWKTIDAGLTWTELTNSPSMYWGAVATSGDGQIVLALAVSPPSADHFLYRSTDAGASWSLIRTTIEQLNDIAVSDLGDIVVLATSVGIFKSINSGTSFMALQNVPYATTIDISSDGLKIVAAHYYSNIRKSTNGGDTWIDLQSSGTNWNQVAISDDGQTIMGVAKGNAAGVVSSRDAGQTFTSANIGSTFVGGQATFAGMSDDGLVLIASSYGSIPQMSTDGGLTWSSSGLSALGWTGFALSDTGSPHRRIISITENARVFSNRPIPVPTLTTISPSTGSIEGGMLVTLTGTEIHDVISVTIGGVLVVDFDAISDTTLSFIAPAGNVGAVDIVVTTEDGVATLSGEFTYIESVFSAVDSADEILALPESLVTSKSEVIAGDSLTISVPGFVPGEYVQIILASTPQLLASTTADSGGVVATTIVFPREIEGSHTLALFAPVSGRGMRQSIVINRIAAAIDTGTLPTVVGSDTLPKTGSEIHLWLPSVIASLGLLLAAISGIRRRKIA
jgi:LPXTG-motif cell wall-anchored protein